MVPKKLADEMRRRRLMLKLKQVDVARTLGTSRAYVSAVEGGVAWEPDAEKLVAWSTALGWEPDYLLRRMGRIDGLAGVTPVSPDLMRLITEAVAAGVREGIEEALADIRDAAPDDPSRPDARPPARLT